MLIAKFDYLYKIGGKDQLCSGPSIQYCFINGLISTFYMIDAYTDFFLQVTSLGIYLEIFMLTVIPSSLLVVAVLSLECELIV